MHVEQTVRKVFKKPTKSKNQESHAIFQSMDGTSSDSQQKHSANRFGQFLTSQQLKRKVEVCVKNLSQDEDSCIKIYGTRKIIRYEISVERCSGHATRWIQNRVYAMSMLQSSLPVATVRNLMNSNRMFKKMKSDMVEKRVHAHRDEKLAVVVWSVTAWPTGKTCQPLLDSDQKERQR